jgi:hypothetical protein
MLFEAKSDSWMRFTIEAISGNGSLTRKSHSENDKLILLRIFDGQK